MSITREELMDNKLEDLIRMCDNNIKMFEKDISIMRSKLSRIKNMSKRNNIAKILTYHEIIDGDIRSLSDYEFLRSMLKEVQEVKKY